MKHKGYSFPKPTAPIEKFDFGKGLDFSISVDIKKNKKHIEIFRKKIRVL